MGKNLGIAALILSVIAIFIPVLGTIAGWIALIIAAVATLYGETMFSIITVVVSAVGYLFLSPILMTGASSQLEAGATPWGLIITIIMLAAPIIGMMLCRTGKVRLGQ